MTTIREKINLFGMRVLGGSSEASGKRRAFKRFAKEQEVIRPGSKVKVIGFISSLFLGQSKRYSPE